jgi:hypothetical protein
MIYDYTFRASLNRCARGMLAMLLALKLLLLCGFEAAARPFELSLTVVYRENAVAGAAYEVFAQHGHHWTKEYTVCAWLGLTNPELNADALSPRSSASCFPGTLGMIPVSIKSSGYYKLSAAVVPKYLTSLNDQALLSDVSTLEFEASFDTATLDKARAAEHEQMIRNMRAKLLQEGPSEQRESLWEKFHEQVRQLLLDPDGDPFMIRTKPELRAFLEPCVPSACVEQLQLLQAHPRWSQVLSVM